MQNGSARHFVGGVINAARRSCGMTQTQAAMRANLSPQTVLDLEQGRGTLASLVPIFEALDIRLAGMPRGRSLHERLSVARRRRGLSLEALARQAGVSKGALVRLERGIGRVATLEAALRVVAPNARARKLERANWQGGSRDCRFTPPELFATLVRVFGAFELDPCGDPDSRISVPRKYMIEDDGLRQPWRAESAFVNPPYSDTVNFVKKGFDEWRTGSCGLVVLLLPTRCHGRAFHEIIAPFATTFFLRDRIKFHGRDGPRDAAPFGNMIVVFGASEEMVDRMTAEMRCVVLRPSGHRDALSASAAA